MSVHGQGLHAQDDRRYRQAVIDLTYLLNEGALDGVAEVIRERRRQIEQKSYTPAHDLTAHADGALMEMAAGALSALADQRLEGLADPATDQTALAEGAALAAAEIDRLTEFDPEPASAGMSGVPFTGQASAYLEDLRSEPRCWTHNSHTHHVHGPRQPCPLGYGP